MKREYVENNKICVAIHTINGKSMNFENLVSLIDKTHIALQSETIKAINRNLTIRNWLIGFYIVEFEQNGEDRAKYGEKLLQKVAERINSNSFSFRNLKLFRQFYIAYPQIGQTLSAQLQQIDYIDVNIEKALTIYLSDNIKWGTASPKLNVPVEKLLSKLSFSHLVELLDIDNHFKRVFYEIECIKGNWSVRELRRQINTLYYERSGLSQKPEKLSEMVQNKAEILVPTDVVKSPFAFEFLGLKAKDVVYENDLEQALIEHLSEFLIELGTGFCFEARQKRITIGDEYFFIDLVFYHRTLRCHFIVELKNDEFKYEHIAQLKVYLNYYKKEVVPDGDNPPIGLLLVTNKNNTLVEYAVADSDQNIFVSKYLLELPAKEKFIKFVEKELKQF